MQNYVILWAMQTIWDPLRKKDVALTPEEEVRQRCIAFLLEKGVPVTHAMSEVPLDYGQKHFRADIVVYDRALRPLMVVECKRPDVTISAATVRQALMYHAVLDISYIVLTNGRSIYLYGRNASSVFEPMREFPDYETLLLCRR